MIAFSTRATRQFRELREHYERLARPEAIRGLVEAVQDAMQKIEANKAIGLAAPRPYPHLARPGLRWIKAGRYWLAYSATAPPVIVGIFYDTANIPRRL